MPCKHITLIFCCAASLYSIGSGGIIRIVIESTYQISSD